MLLSTRPKKRPLTDDIAIHFRFLGLRRGECRSDIIRSAAHSMSSMLTINEQHFHATTVDRRRAQIAVATYRLLDPRQRQSLYERVQLAYPIDRVEDALTEAARVQSIGPCSTDPLATVWTPESISLQPSSDRMMQSEAQSGELGESAESETVSTMDERRSIVKTLRESDESTLRGLSPLGWLRSRIRR